MTARRFYLGVDGGGTKTEFVGIDDKGKIVARAVTGTTYHLQVGLDEAANRIRDGVANICAELRITPGDIAYAFFGLPAFGEDAAIDPLLDEACGRILGHHRYRCGNDMVCGWAGSLGCEDGINLVAGTGSIGYGERQGRTARVGGWGEIADVAKLVSEAAGAGDAVARIILEDAGRELAAMATALCNALGFPDEEPIPLSWSGGVLSNQPLVSDALSRHLGNRFMLIEPRYPPGHGAALYARLLSLHPRHLEGG